MLYTYKELKDIYGHNDIIKRKIANKNFFKLERGIYSDKKEVPYIALVMKKYPNTVISSDTAYYYHNLTDYIPTKIFLTSKRTFRRIDDNNIVQLFSSEHFYKLGIEKIDYNGTEITIYNKERMLIELMRNSKNISYDYYKEIITNYRKIADDLDLDLISEYLTYFQFGNTIFEKIHREVF